MQDRQTNIKVRIHKGGLHLTHGLNLHLHNPWFKISATQSRGPILDACKARYAYFALIIKPWVM